jgi:hypothetical protein
MTGPLLQRVEWHSSSGRSSRRGRVRVRLGSGIGAGALLSLRRRIQRMEPDLAPAQLDLEGITWLEAQLGGVGLADQLADLGVGIWGLIGSGVCGSRIACLVPDRRGKGITSGRRDARSLTSSVVIPARVLQP